VAQYPFGARARWALNSRLRISTKKEMIRKCLM
jgi:hypothetical protein